jgi:AcrR family transcriptional regulator
LSIVITETPVRRSRRPAAQTREHILDVAEQLFYWQGIRATGVDQIVAAADIAPTTLYRLFGSKDDLVAAYVDRYADGYRDWVDSLTGNPSRPARSRILAYLDALAANTGPDAFRGCPFLMALAEYPDAESAAHASAQSVKAWVRAKLRELAGQLPGQTAATARVVGDQLALVVEGLYASTAALGTRGPAGQAHAVAALVIDSAVAGRRGGAPASTRPVRAGRSR